jgi:hypothetical protein
MSGIQSTGGHPQTNPINLRVPPIRLPAAGDLRIRQGTSGAVETGAARSTDTVSLRPGLAQAASAIAPLEKTLHEAQTTVDQLDRVGTLLDELRGLLRDHGSVSSDSGVADTQARIDAIIESINQVDAAASRYDPQSSPLGLGYQIQTQPPGGAANATGYAIFAPGETEIEVEVQFVASAQHGGFYLSLGAANLNLTGGTGFTIEIEGSRGVRLFTFISGTTTNSIAQAINQFSAQTGVVARQFDGSSYLPTGLQLRSTEFGDDAFVSVRLLSSGGIESAPGHADNTGLYRFIENSSNTADTAPGSRTAFSQAYDGVTDHGQDVEALINGVQAQVNGNRMHAAGDSWRIAFDFDPYITQLWSKPFTPLRFVNTSRGSEGAAQDPTAPIEEYARDLESRRAAATQRRDAAREQLRAALNALPGVGEAQAPLGVLAELRASLLNQKST